VGGKKREGKVAFGCITTKKEEGGSVLFGGWLPVDWIILGGKKTGGGGGKMRACSVKKKKGRSRWRFLPGICARGGEKGGRGGPGASAGEKKEGGKEIELFWQVGRRACREGGKKKKREGNILALAGEGRDLGGRPRGRKKKKRGGPACGSKKKGKGGRPPEGPPGASADSGPRRGKKKKFKKRKGSLSFS